MSKFNGPDEVARAVQDATEPLANDMLRGVRAIAQFLGESERATFYWLQNGRVPGVSKVGRSYVGFRSLIAEGLRSRAKVGKVE